VLHGIRLARRIQATHAGTPPICTGLGTKRVSRVEENTAADGVELTAELYNLIPRPATTMNKRRCGRSADDTGDVALTVVELTDEGVRVEPIGPGGSKQHRYDNSKQHRYDEEGLDRRVPIRRQRRLGGTVDNRSKRSPSSH
jgi:hypothetical protein